MKKLTALSILFISLAFVAPIQASAATSAGIKPGSFFYFFDITFENIGLFFTFSPEQKVKKALEHADERLAEIEAVAEEKNPDAVKTAIANYKSNVALATEKSKEVKDKGQAEILLTSIANNASRNQKVLTAILVKVPEEAREAIAHAIEVSRKGQEETTKQITELKSEIERLKNKVGSLKKESSGPQADEIEKLKKEISVLKENQRGSQPALKQPAPAVQQPQEQRKLESSIINNEAQKLAEEQKRQDELKKQQELERARLEELRRQQEIETDRTLQERTRRQKLTELQNQKTKISSTLSLVRQQKTELDSLYQSKITLLSNQKNTELVNLEVLYKRTLTSLRDDYASRGLYSGGVRIKAEEDLLAAYNSDKSMINNYYDGTTNALVSEKNTKLLDLDIQIINLEDELNSVNRELSQ